MITHHEDFGNLFEFLPKSGLKAAEGKPQGRYPFFSSSNVQTKRVDSATYFVEALILGTGGSASVHHVKGGFSTSNDCLVAKVKRSDLVDIRFCFQFLTGNISLLEAGFRGAGLRHVSKGYIEAIEIPLPSLEHQQQIAEVMDKADALRAKRHATLAQLDALTQSIFFAMFGDPAANSKGWQRAKLGELLTVGPQNGLYKPASDYGSGTPILRIDTFYNGVITKLAVLKRVRITDKERDLYGLHPGDIVINRVNSMEYLGKSALIPNLDEPTVFESNMMRFEIDHKQLESQYFIQFLQTSFIKTQIDTAAKHAVNQSSINQQDIKGFEINVPPLPLQLEFARRITAMEKLKSAQRTSLKKMDEFFAALQGCAFRGEL